MPAPDPHPGEALVKVAACGVCATDLHYRHGTPTFKKPPMVLGHEISGIVEDVRDESPFAKGDKVLIPAVLSCGACGNCREGRDNICEKMKMVGNHIDGGFAEFVVVPSKMLFKLPNELPLLESAIISDAVSTPFHAVKNRGAVRAGEWVAVFGCGGVGLNAVQAAASLGGIVVAVDVDDRKLDLAKRLGAAETVNSTTKDAPKVIRELTGGGVDVAFEVVGKPSVLDLAFSSVRQGGRLVTVGYSEENWNFRVNRVMFREMAVIGSLGSRLSEYPRIIELVRRGKIKLAPLVSDRLSLESINDSLDRLEKGSVLGRQIVVL
ncbi:MAG: zinc-binding dehydrogenase [Nitrososphaerota archaeon]|nr:zinc-binding dehydrogenase [Nitrososphaerota archaeon]